MPTLVASIEEGFAVSPVSAHHLPLDGDSTKTLSDSSTSLGSKDLLLDQKGHDATEQNPLSCPSLEDVLTAPVDDPISKLMSSSSISSPRTKLGLPPLAPTPPLPVTSPLTAFLAPSMGGSMGGSLTSVTGIQHGLNKTPTTPLPTLQFFEIRAGSSTANTSISCNSNSYSGLFHRRAPATSYVFRSPQKRSRTSDAYVPVPSPDTDLPLTPRKSFVSSAFVMALICVLIVCYLPRRFAVPAHMLGQPLKMDGSFLSIVEAKALRDMLRGSGPLSARQDRTVYDVTGERSEEEVCCDEGSFESPMTYTNDHLVTSPICSCSLRTDIARHYLRTGGPDGKKESALSLWRRAQTFQMVLEGRSAMEQVPIIKHLLVRKRTHALIAGVCGGNTCHPVTRATIDVLLPGQVIPVGISAPDFNTQPSTNATSSLPPWLRSVMMFSGLFDSAHEKQADITAFFHSWRGGAERGGAMRVWQAADGVAIDISASSMAAVALDGSRVVHSKSTLYMPAAAPPPLPYGKALSLSYNTASTMWEVAADGEVVASYREDDLRFSITVTTKCSQSDSTPNLAGNTSEIMSILRKELHHRKASFLESGSAAFQRQLTRAFIKYPLPPTDVPYNYCWWLESLGDWTHPLMKIICDR